MASPDNDSIRALNALVDGAINLVQQLKGALAQIQKESGQTSETQREAPKAESTSTPPNDPLSLARDAAALIKAHSTKLSLLVITEPLTPSAISTVIRELVSGPLTGTATAVELCEPRLYTEAFQLELLWRSQGVYTGLIDLLQKIPRDGKVLTGDAKAGFVASGRGSLASTGVLWSACDKIEQLTTQGLRGFYVDKVREWKDTLRDVTEELKEWGDEEPESDEDEDDGASNSDADEAAKSNGAHPSAQDMVDDFMGSSGTIPRDDPDGIRPRLELALRRLRLAVILCMAVDKRRVKKLPTGTPSEAIIARLSKATDDLRQLPEDFGDLAAALYELDPEEIDDAMERCCSRAVSVGETLQSGWDGETDEFSEWMTKFRSELRKA
jgi:hypothetical protein